MRRPPLSRTLRRQAIVLLAIFAMLSSAVFLLAARLQRSYASRGAIQVSAQAFDPIPELQHLPEAAVEHFQHDAAADGIELRTTTENAVKTLHLSASAPNRALAQARVRRLGDGITTYLQHRVDELATAYRTELTKQSEALAAREGKLTKEIQTFRLSHRGVLPDDPTSVIAQFEKLSTKLDDKQQRQHIVTDQIKRLEDYKAKRQTAGGQSLAPPPPIAPAPQDSADGSGAAGPDPEVATLSAQLQLVNQQIDEQINKWHRTEEHPYVKDLRSQQADLQKKLEAARHRVAAGQPAPADSAMPTPPAHAAGNDASLAAAQQVDLELQSLQAENDTLDAEIRKLSAQREVMQREVDQVMPVRQEYEKLTGQLAATQKDQQAVAGKMESLNHAFSDAAGGSGTGPVEITALALEPSSSLPTYPQLPLIYMAGVVLGGGVAWLIALALHRLDHTFHSGREASAVLGIPVLGVVSEIRSRGRARLHRAWLHVLRPVIGVALLLVVIGSAFVCYRDLADPGIAGANATQQPVASIDMSNKSGVSRL